MTYFEDIPKSVDIEFRDNPIHVEYHVMPVLEEVEDWRSPIARYLLRGIRSTYKIEARKVINTSYKFRVIQEELHKQSYLGPLLFCVSEGKIDQTLYERIQSVPRQPVTEMSPVVSAIPFAMWGINLVGQFLKPPVKYKDVVLAVDYFSKWVEAAPLRSTTSDAIEEFIWKNIITRYGIPKILVLDNGPQFDSRVIKEMCAKLGIEDRFAPVCYLQYNGQVEVMNRIIFNGIKKNLLESGMQ
ncbi:hypothetical protein LIER_05539 [Lithospermum erythrorhizon]|uniref:Integrase catalytic domain-containing protein n=1 Tax=Lithospermum erythrorhizon TaxID=34254 RepID=A0AAV3P292_LITER